MLLKKNKLFYKYLISYLLIMLIPTLVLTAFINQSLLRRLRIQYTDTAEEILQQFKISADNNISQLPVIRDHILSQSDLSLQTGLQNIQNARTIITELKKYTVSNGFIQDIGLYIIDDAYIYTSASTYPIDRFFSGHLCYQSWSTEDFQEIAANGDGRYIRPAETISYNGRDMDVITILYPLQVNRTKFALLFLIDTSFFYTHGNSTVFFLQDEFDNLIFSTAKGPHQPETYTGNGFIANSCTSNTTNLTYSSVSSTEDIYQDYLYIQKNFYLILFFVLASGVIVICLSMIVNYNPLLKLKKFAEGIRDGRNRNEDGLASIEEALTQLVNENIELRDKSADAARQQFLQMLLKGHITDEEVFRQQTEQLNLVNLSGPCFFVLIIVMKPSDAFPSLPEAYRIEEIISLHLPGYIREHSESGKYVYLGSLESTETLTFQHHTLDIQDSLHKHFSMDTALANSFICESFEKIPACYMDASLAIDYRFIKGSNCIIDSSQLVPNEAIGAVYPQQLFDKLNYQLKSGDADKLEEVLHEIISYIKQSDLPLYYAKGLCYQLINTISSIIDHINHDLPGKRSKLSYATVLADFDTAEELISAVRNICLNICACIRNEKSAEENELIGSIRKYIDENVMDANFSVQNMANHFHMSLPAISSFFKYQCSITIMDYVTDIRMKRAIELLMEEEMTLNDIVANVGYLNTSSFIRKFKSIYGLTPGQYVKHHKETLQ